jgi:threonine/homoserine efflux transporter RhtA
MISIACGASLCESLFPAIGPDNRAAPDRKRFGLFGHLAVAIEGRSAWLLLAQCCWG